MTKSCVIGGTRAADAAIIGNVRSVLAAGAYYVVTRREGLNEAIPGGAARNLDPRRYNARELKVGTAIEMEHTRSRRVAREIAMDHLTEDHRYYTKLCKCHREPACRGL
jgi:hypothetical protein